MELQSIQDVLRFGRGKRFVPRGLLVDVEVVHDHEDTFGVGKMDRDPDGQASLCPSYGLIINRL